MCGAAAGARRGGQQQVEQALFGVELGPVFHLFQFFFAHHVHGDLDQVADHRFHVPPDITNLGELGGFHLHEGRIGELGQAARNLRFAHAGGPDHDDVLGHDLFGDIRRQLLPAHPVSQRNGHGPLGGALADDMLIQLRHDFPWRKVFEREFQLFRGSW